MDPIAVTAALLRAQLPDVPIREGASMMARVASQGEGHAVIVIAGIPVTAQLPPEVQAGATLRLKVQEVTPERVMLQIEPQQPQPRRSGRGIPRPGDRPRSPRRNLQANVEVEEPPARRRGADGEPPTSSRSPSNRPTLGRLDLRLELRGERLLAEDHDPGRPSARHRQRGR